MENDGFVSAILARPEDETLRLVYADWLDDRYDPRGEFLRVHAEWTRSWNDEPNLDLDDRVESLRAVIDPDWVAVMTTLGLPSEPLALLRDTSNTPLTEPLVIRECKRRQTGPLGGLVTFASQFRSSGPDAGLISDLRVLSGIDLELVDCYYGSTNFPIYPFLAELRIATSEPSAEDVLAALQAREFQGDGGPGSYEDSIHTDSRNQPFFSIEEGFSGMHGVLARYVAQGRLWYVNLHTRNAEYRRDAFSFAVGASPHGDRLVGLIAGGWWS